MRSRLKTGALFIASIFFSLLLGEMLTRAIIPQQLIDANPDIWRYDDRVGYRHKENADAIVNSGQGPHRFVTDEYGYRICPVRVDTNARSPDITLLALGDSFLEAVSLNNEQTIPELLGRRLREKYGLEVKALNAGTSGWDPNYYLLEAQRSLALQKVDLGMVFLFIGNDIVEKFDTTAQTGLLTNKPRTQFRTIGEWLYFNLVGPVRTFIEARSHLYILIRHQAYAFFSWLGVITRTPMDVFFIEQKDSTRWEVTADICERIRLEFGRYGIPVLFVLLPPLYQVNEELFYRYAKCYGLSKDEAGLEQPNRLLAEAFTRRSLLLIDPLYCLRRKADQGLELYGKVDRHFSAAGHEAVAEFLLPCVEGCLQARLSKNPGAPDITDSTAR